jgi:hypothetical protein
LLELLTAVLLNCMVRTGSRRRKACRLSPTDPDTAQTNQLGTTRLAGSVILGHVVRRESTLQQSSDDRSTRRPHATHSM